MTINTRPDEGTIFSIRLPLTMATIQVLLASVAEETYCIPLSYIAETIKVSTKEIRTVEQHPMIPYRDTVLPLTHLREKFGLPSLPPPQTAPGISTGIHTVPVVVVVGEGAKKAGLIVDGLLGQQEAVIKPLTGILKKIQGISGATVLSTGRVAPILDIPSLF